MITTNGDVNFTDNFFMLCQKIFGVGQWIDPYTLFFGEESVSF